jgi:hypothetical protein
VQAVLRARTEIDIAAYLHGHASDGEPLRAPRSTHLAFSVDVPRSRLLVVPPHVLDGREWAFRDDVSHLETLARALEGFIVLRAGKAGLLSLRSAPISANDPLVRYSRVFRSVTDYVVARHAKRLSAAETVVLDVRRECGRIGIPAPDVRVTEVRGVAGTGVVARVELIFAVAVRGPLLLGRTRYLGGGLLVPA